VRTVAALRGRPVIVIGGLMHMSAMDRH